jgi:hypothetical protein
MGGHRVTDRRVPPGTQAQQRNRHVPAGAPIRGDQVRGAQPAGVADGQRHLRRLAPGDPVRVGDPVDVQPWPPERESRSGPEGDGRRGAEQREIGVAEPEPEAEQDDRGRDDADAPRFHARWLSGNGTATDVIASFSTSAAVTPRS